MMKRLMIFSSLMVAVLAGPLHGQTAPTNKDDKSGITDEAQRERFWEANVGGGQYTVALSRISSVSRHRYILDGSLLVNEVTVDTTGQALVRFYYITPVTDEMRGTGIGAAASRLVDRGKQMVERGSDVTGTQIHEMVQNKFPVTTHAKEIEYRILSESALLKLYGSVKTAWETGRGRIFTIR